MRATHLLVDVDEAEVRLGRLKDLPAHLSEVLVAHIHHQAVADAHVLDERVLLVLGGRQVELLDETARHADERVLLRAELWGVGGY